MALALLRSTLSGSPSSLVIIHSSGLVFPIIHQRAFKPPVLFPQENYFGEDDMYTDFEEAVSSPVLSTSTSSGLGWSPLGMEDGERKDTSDLHPLDLRPWDITVLINLYKVHGRLPIVRRMTPNVQLMVLAESERSV